VANRWGRVLCTPSKCQQADCFTTPKTPLVRREFLVPTKSVTPNRIAAMMQSFRRSTTGSNNSGCSYIVDRLEARTTKKHGITGPELERSSGAIRFMELHCQRRGGWLLGGDHQQGCAASDDRRNLEGDHSTTGRSMSPVLQPRCVWACTLISHLSAIAKSLDG
jgi:hypothetical protein